MGKELHASAEGCKWPQLGGQEVRVGHKEKLYPGGKVDKSSGRQRITLLGGL